MVGNIFLANFVAYIFLLLLPGVAYPGVRDNRSTLNTKTGYDDDDDVLKAETLSK